MRYYLGLDIGSTTSKAVAMNARGNILVSIVHPSGHDAAAISRKLLDETRQSLENFPADGRRKKPRRGKSEFIVVATGYGRSLVPKAKKTMTEIICHARGVNFLHPMARTIIDIGGQDSKVIVLEKDGSVLDFRMNDRCAAGTGSFLESMAKKFGLSVEEAAEIHSSNPTPLEINSTCVVFAETEVVSLISHGKAMPDVLAGVMRALSRRVASLARQISSVRPIYFSGGVARNETIRRQLQDAIGSPVIRSDNCQLTAAIGAAVIAREIDR